MKVDALDHFTIVTADLDTSIAFYTDVIGLSNGERPPFDFPGAWLYCGDRAVLHLIGAEQGREQGVIDHAAFRLTGYQEMMARLKKVGAKYRETQLPGWGITQVFVDTPDNAMVELIFQPDDVGAKA